MTTNTPTPSLPSNVEPWVIRKSGAFYRANRSGYTVHIEAAGIYTREEAEREARIEDSISAHPLSEYVGEITEQRDRAQVLLDKLPGTLARASASVTDAPWMEAIDLMITGEHGGGDPWWRGFQMLKDAFFAAGGNHPAPWAHDRCWVDDHHTEEAVKGFTTPTAHGEGELVQRAIDAAHEAFFQHLIGRQPRAHFDDMLPPRRNSDARDAVATALKTYRAALSHAPSPRQQDGSGLVETIEREADRWETDQRTSYPDNEVIDSFDKLRRVIEALASTPKASGEKP